MSHARKAGSHEAEAIAVAVGAVVLDGEGRVLLVRHRPERGGYWAGKWICPGGRLKLGETLAEGARREIREETHLEICIQRMIPPFERIVKKRRRTVLHVVYIDFLARCSSTHYTPDDDVGEARWVDARQLLDMAGDLHEDTRSLLILAGVWPGEQKSRELP
jgi:8-oxo-dGTP diphosphatase